MRLETYEARVSDLKVDYEVDDNFRHVSGTITAYVQGCSGQMVNFVASFVGKELFKATADVDHTGKAQVEFRVNDAKLWYPHGYGQQPLYTIAATLTNGKDDLHSTMKRTGFRRGELVQRPDDVGRTFYFRINGIDVFCGGSDWIPADSFTPRITEARYRRWLEMMVDGCQVMIRIWGGGIYEEDIFYDICDELGVLVWQDFMFSCGNYSSEILKSIGEEAACQTKRLRHHPSIVIYAGNNEDYQIAEQYGLTYDYKDKDWRNWLKTDFPARYIYEKANS